MCMKCTRCPVSCGADRHTRAGACSATGLKIAKHYLHPYEEPPISFLKGSGCVFFCGCPLKCVFCQNFEVSRALRGKEITAEQLAEIFFSLEEQGAENINLVTPSHFTEEIAAALKIYRPRVPVVYNTHAYEKLHTLQAIASYIDIWLPDIKFMSADRARRYTARADYTEYALPAIRFMAETAPKFSEEGKMLSGCIVRHLVMPQGVEDSVAAVNFVATLPKGTFFSLMSQYTPCGDISAFPELNRRITLREYNKVLSAVSAAGLKNVFLQELSSSGKAFIPQWDY